MDPYRGFYEYPSQTAVLALPSKNIGSVTPAKAKRTWGSILRIPGLSKKDRDNNSSQQATVYSPQFNLPQAYGYISSKYPSQNSQFITSTPYRDPSKYYLPSNKERYGNYNVTYGRAAGTAVRSVVSPAQANAKNAIKYTDWFGSVVGRKPPVRPALPVFHSTASPSADKGLSPVSSWDRYISIQAPQAAVEVPALVPLQSYNVCMCPDQIFSTRSKKKKKCKQCGKKYETVKNATAIGSVTRIRPAIPPSFYKVPANAPWAWPQGATLLYSQPVQVPVRGPPNPNYLREADEEEDSPPPTPETVRTVRSGNSSKSNGSNSTITQDFFFPPKSIPPPPSVPLPSIPQSSKVLSSASASLASTPKKTDKGVSIIGSVKTAYELIDCGRRSASGSDTDELSDNAVHNSWENLESTVNGVNKRDEKRPSEINGHNRVSVISISGNNDVSHSVNNNDGVISTRNDDSNKVRIFNGSFSKVVIENKCEKNQKLKPNIISSRHINDRSNDGHVQSHYESNGYHNDKSENSLFESGNSPPHPRKRSSHINKKKKANTSVKEEETRNYYTSSSESDPVEELSKVFSIAGRRVLLDQKQGTKSYKSSSNKLDQKANVDKLANGTSSIPEITDWDSLQEYVNSSTVENRRLEVNDPGVTTNGFENFASRQGLPDTLKISYHTNNSDYKRTIISSDIRDIIHEEEEEEEDATKGSKVEEIKEMERKAYKVNANSKLFRNEVENEVESEDIPTINGYADLEKDEEVSTPSPVEPFIRTNGFQPTLSELLQVKSILKRPNSLDTSSETDSDFYLPTVSEFKQNMRKKKSVQFRQSDEVNLVEGAGESKGRKVSSLKAARRERGRKKDKEAKNDTAEDVHDIYGRNGLTNSEFSPFRNGFNDKYNNNWNSIEEKDPVRSGDQDVEDDSSTDCSPSDNLTENSPTEETTQQLNKGSSNLRRTFSHRQTVDASMPAFNDTYRLRQTASRPSLHFHVDSSSGQRKPTRRAPPPPKHSPIRPTVPPPPPPPPPPPSFNSTLPHSEASIKSDSVLGEETCDNEVASSLSSTSLSPPPSPPPPLPSSPPPLLSSSSPPLDLEDEPIVGASSPGLAFSSFIDPRSPVSISTRTQRVQPSATEISIQDLKETLSSRNYSSSSIFETRDNDNLNLATIKGRVKATKPPNSTPDSVPPSVSSYNNTKLTNHCSAKRPTKSNNPNPSHRLSFLSRMVEETDAEERMSDHIYEELPSFPSSPSGSISTFQERSIFDGASKYEILEFLQDARNRVDIAVDEEEEINLINPLSTELSTMGLEDEEDQTGVDSQDDPLLPSRYTDGRSSNRSSNSESSENSGLLRSDKERLAAGEIERTDSGVGSETSKPLVSLRRNAKSSPSSSTTSGCLVGLREGDLPPCDDCDTPVEARVTNSGLMYAPLVCRRCARRRQERKEILTEIIETEVKYGRDLKVMMEQFCRPMRVAGLLSRDRLNRIFLNVDELIDHNRQFSLQLRDAYEIALDQGDEDLLTVNVAKLFLQASPMLHAFQNYCVRQGAASILLQNLEKEKELLRIFLKVSQMENTLLRRMNLHSFLMVPVQRVTKYPLLLARLFKTTPPSHPSREDCRRAREKIELYLQHINNETKEMSPIKLWRRISMSVGNNAPPKWVTQPLEHDMSLKLRTVVLDILEWSNDEVCIVREGRLLCLPPESTNWTRRGRGIKMATVQMVLVTLGRPKFTLEEKVPEDGLITPCDLGIKEAAILAFKDHRLTKTALIRDPWYLSRSVITWDAEGESECFELTDLASRETFIFKDRECVGTEEWFRSVQFHALSVGGWRRRRSALANIMINGTSRS